MTGAVKDEAKPAETAEAPPEAETQEKGATGRGKRVMASGANTAGLDGGDEQTEEAGTFHGERVDPNKVKLPLVPHTRVDCLWRDGQYHTARVIEARVRPDSIDGEHEYYVHYNGFNRRMDDWVTLAQIDLSTVDDSMVEGSDGKRKNKKHKQEEHSDDEGHAEFDPNALREHEEFTKVKNIETIELGKHIMDTWYFSPFPPEYNNLKQLYFCEFTLEFFKQRSQMIRHLRKVSVLHPPGDEIYRNGKVSMFEVDGRREKQYCQNLCYLAKLFLDHKTLYYDVDLFLFYVLCECDERGAHIVGYFSKEKCSEEGYNLACILSLPCYQRRGYGKFLISFSYELSKIENKVGTPERPLSDLGLVSYRSYWTRVLLTEIQKREGTISIKELSDITAIKTDDIISTLQHLNLIQYQKGQHVIYAASKVIEKHLKDAGSAGVPVDPTKIIWTPYNAEREYANYRS